MTFVTILTLCLLVALCVVAVLTAWLLGEVRGRLNHVYRRVVALDDRLTDSGIAIDLILTHVTPPKHAPDRTPNPPPRHPPTQLFKSNGVHKAD